jgi:exonuclease III
MRLDYVYVSGGLAGQVRSARIDSEAQGSDHQPVWAELEA